jgi:glycosyltransferase involved in cell wall biosynthesis
MPPLRVLQVDPSAYTPPYDHALCTALAEAGAQVTLATSRFGYGEVPAPAGYVRDERAFYTLQPGAASSRARLAAKLAQHVPDMLRLRRRAAGFDVVHFQWLAVQYADAALLPRRVPLVLTAHDVLPREQRVPGQRAAQRRLYDRVDAVVVHSRHGRERLVAAGVDPAKLEVIPHGAFTHLTTLEPAALPLPDPDVPVVLFFGLLRPYKGLDILLEAWQGIERAELWIVGNARMDVAPLRAAAPPGVRWLTRFVSDAEAAALFRRADVAVLPYREIDQSGVLFTALAFGTPLVLSAVGGFPEIDAAVHVPPGDVGALRDALREVLGDENRRAWMRVAAERAVATGYSWEAIAARHIALYARLLA